MSSWFLEGIRVLTPVTTTDRYGNTVTTWDGAAERDEKCLVAPGGSTEPLLDARTPVESDFDLLFPGRDPGITVADRVKVRGLTCDVVGRPFAYQWGSSPGMAGTKVRVSIKEG